MEVRVKSEEVGTMINKKAEKIIKRLQEGNRTYSIQLLGDRKNKEYGFSILMNLGGFFGEENEIYRGININAIDLLKEAEIKFKMI